MMVRAARVRNPERGVHSEQLAADILWRVEKKAHGLRWGHEIDEPR
jgi:hypothetical protein